jgi:hypothetical protein
MFDSTERLKTEIASLLDGLRSLAGGRYVCVLEPNRILFETPEPEDAASFRLRRLIEERAASIFAIPGGLEAGTPMDDAFDDWEQDEFFLAVINGRVAVLVACPDAESLRETAMRPLRALADRLFRYNETYRLDPRGRGLFFGRPRLDLVVVGRAAEGG